MNYEKKIKKEICKMASDNVILINNAYNNLREINEEFGEFYKGCVTELMDKAFIKNEDAEKELDEILDKMFAEDPVAAINTILEMLMEDLQDEV